VSFWYEKDKPIRVFKKRTAKSFLVSVRHISKKYSYDKIADFLDINKWHVWQIANNPAYSPSRKLCRKLNLVKRIRHRIAISKVDAHSAARSIVRNCEYDKRELIRELEEL
jgi:hypothetical protein